MNNHYFSDNRQLSENRKDHTFRFWCFDLTFTTDNGVFAKEGVDLGTKILLETIFQHKEELQHQLLDVGCGYGPIGISLKKAFPEKNITMLDINPRAVELAQHNAKKNQVDVDIKVSNLYEEVHEETYTDIISNPPIRAGKKVIYTIFQEAYDQLDINGSLWIVIRKNHGAISAKSFIESIYGNCEIIEKKKGFFIMKAVKKEL